MTCTAKRHSLSKDQCLPGQGERQVLSVLPDQHKYRTAAGYARWMVDSRMQYFLLMDTRCVEPPRTKASKTKTLRRYAVPSANSRVLHHRVPVKCKAVSLLIYIPAAYAQRYMVRDSTRVETNSRTLRKASIKAELLLSFGDGESTCIEQSSDCALSASSRNLRWRATTC